MKSAKDYVSLYNTGMVGLEELIDTAQKEAYNEAVNNHNMWVEKQDELMIEFADYCQTFELNGLNYCPVKKTTAQLLEQFTKLKEL